MEQDKLRQRLIYAVKTVGLKQKQICENTGISMTDLSRFKNQKILLCQPDAFKLSNYFDKFFLVEL